MTFRITHFTYQINTYKPWEQAQPYNLTLITTPPPTRIFTQIQGSDRPAASYQQIDFQFPNVALQAFAQSQVKPVVVGTVDETVPAAQPRPIDFQYANLIIRQPVGKPVFNPDFYSAPAPTVRQQDFAFPNLAPFAPIFQPITVYWGPIPQAPAHPTDLQPANIALRPVVQKPIFNLIFDRPPQPVLHVDFQFPNIPLEAFAQLQVKPVSVNQGFDGPVATAVRSDAPLPNLLTTTLSVVVTKPTFNLDVSAPAPTVRQQDFQFPNLTGNAPVFQPVTAFWGPIPQTQIPPADLQPVNIAIRPTVAVTKPAAQQVGTDRPQAQPQQLDFQFPNLVLAPTLFTFRAPLISRQSPTAPPTDPPLPNLLTTTLAPPAQKPLVNFAIFFDRRPTPPAPQDQATPNILVSLLSAPQLKPIAPNQYYFLLSDRPAPTAPSWDQAQPNNTIFIPPPPPPTGLHQNPVFISMGKLMYLGNLPS